MRTRAEGNGVTMQSAPASAAPRARETSDAAPQGDEIDLCAAFARLTPGRRVHGISALLLPYSAEGRRDDAAFERLLQRTHAAGLEPAVNMDTGFVDLLEAHERREVLERTRRTLGAGVPFCAGAFAGAAGAHEDTALPAYRAAIREIEALGGTPVLVQCRPWRLSVQQNCSLHARVLEGVSSDRFRTRSSSRRTGASTTGDIRALFDLPQPSAPTFVARSGARWHGCDCATRRPSFASTRATTCDRPRGVRQ